jgi:DNA-binding response OmpR family regulator
MRSDIMTSSVLVFVVEDDELIRLSLEDALTEGGFDVTIAADGETAMALLDAEGGNYSALITDIKLPGRFTGWDVARHAREINDKVPVIYITGDSGHDWSSKGVPNSRLMLKPFALAQVVTAVSQLINATAAERGRLNGAEILQIA